MDFDISEEQELLQETVSQAISNECPITKVREIFDGDSGHDPALWSSLGEIGIHGIAVPEEYGGAGLELLDLALVSEVFGAAATPGPFLGHALACQALLLGGSDEQRKSWLPKLVSGEAIGTVALCEAGTGWQPEDWTLEGGAQLTGTKQHVPYASIADAIVVGTAQGGLALVERAGAGVEVKALAAVDHTRRLDQVTFDGAAAEPLPDGAKAAGRVRDTGLVLLAADAYGGARRAVDMAAEYANTREQFGVTIGHFQALKHQLANMAVEVEPTRALAWYAAHAFDHIPDDAERSAALAKAHNTSVYVQASRDAVEAHGGIGFTWEHDMQFYVKRAMFDRAFLGTPEVHRERCAALAGW